MNLLILGATGGKGRALVQQALEQGHTVTAFARDPSKVKTTHANLRVVRFCSYSAEGIFADKKGQEKIIQESKLDWVVVRPARLTNGPRIGVYRGGFDPTDTAIQGKISRSDVADFMLKQLTSNIHLKKAPGISY